MRFLKAAAGCSNHASLRPGKHFRCFKFPLKTQLNEGNNLTYNSNPITVSLHQKSLTTHSLNQSNRWKIIVPPPAAHTHQYPVHHCGAQKEKRKSRPHLWWF